MSFTQPPCNKECPDRNRTCHADCPKYAEWSAAEFAKKSVIKSAQAIENQFIEISTASYFKHVVKQHSRILRGQKVW